MKLKTGITIVMGKPGVGKSTFGAYMAQKYLDKGYKVWSNTPIKGCMKLDLKNDVMTYMIDQGLVIIDEAGLEFDARDFKKFTKEYTEFFKMHRHYELHILVLTQFWDDVDKKVRLLAQNILILQPSLLGLTHCHYKVVTCNVDINDNGEIIERYKFVPWFIGGYKWFYKRRAWDMFETHQRKELVEKEWEVWSSYTKVKLLISIKDKIKNLFTNAKDKSRIKQRLKDVTRLPNKRNKE